MVKMHIQRSSLFRVCIWMARCLSISRGSHNSHMQLSGMFLRSTSIQSTCCHTLLHTQLISTETDLHVLCNAKCIKIITLHLVQMQNIAISICVFLSITAHVSEKQHIETSPSFQCKLPVAVAQSSSHSMQCTSNHLTLEICTYNYHHLHFNCHFHSNLRQ